MDLMVPYIERGQEEDEPVRILRRGGGGRQAAALLAVILCDDGEGEEARHSSTASEMCRTDGEPPASHPVKARGLVRCSRRKPAATPAYCTIKQDKSTGESIWQDKKRQ